MGALNFNDRVVVVAGGDPFVGCVGRIAGLTREGYPIVEFNGQGESCQFAFNPHHLELQPLIEWDLNMPDRWQV